jgi:hypothetical protein
LLRWLSTALPPSQDRYNFFVKAMLLQDIQDALSFVKDQLGAMDNLIEQKQAEVPELEKQARRARVSSLRAPALFCAAAASFVLAWPSVRGLPVTAWCGPPAALRAAPARAASSAAVRRN